MDDGVGVVDLEILNVVALGLGALDANALGAGAWGADALDADACGAVTVLETDDAGTNNGSCRSTGFACASTCGGCACGAGLLRS